MKNYRIFVEKRPGFRVEAESLQHDLNENLGLHLSQLRLLNVYDLFGFTPELLEASRYRVFGEVQTDEVTDACDLEGRKFLAVEYLPGQFDQRAASAVDCVRLIDPEAEVRIRSSRLLLLDAATTDEELARVRKYYINAVESREKDLSVLSDMEQAEVKPVEVLAGLRELTDGELAPYCAKMGLAMNADDLREVVNYFRAEGRDPYETELRILDTYWSDHCRHTTFTTVLTSIRVDESFMRAELEESLELYHKIRRELGRGEKPLCLMDLATIGARYLRKIGKLDDLEVSEENNACSIFVDVDVDGQPEKWLLQFKNETHNHPTEIEPFGGASTCLGGAIRDPLSGRSYVYQAMRVTGAGDIYQPVGETLAGKLQGCGRLFELRQPDRSGHDPRARNLSSRLRGQAFGGGCRGGSREGRKRAARNARCGRRGTAAGRPHGVRRHRRCDGFVEGTQYQVAGNLFVGGAEGQRSGRAQTGTAVPPAGGDAPYQEVERLRRRRRVGGHRRADRRSGHLSGPRADQVRRPECDGAGDQRVAGAHGRGGRTGGHGTVHGLLP